MQQENFHRVPFNKNSPILLTIFRILSVLIYILRRLDILHQNKITSKLSCWKSSKENHLFLPVAVRMILFIVKQFYLLLLNLLRYCTTERNTFVARRSFRYNASNILNANMYFIINSFSFFISSLNASIPTFSISWSTIRNNVTISILKTKNKKSRKSLFLDTVVSIKNLLIVTQVQNLLLQRSRARSANKWTEVLSILVLTKLKLVIF